MVDGLKRRLLWPPLEHSLSSLSSHQRLGDEHRLRHLCSSPPGGSRDGRSQAVSDQRSTTRFLSTFEPPFPRETSGESKGAIGWWSVIKRSGRPIFLWRLRFSLFIGLTIPKRCSLNRKEIETRSPRKGKENLMLGKKTKRKGKKTNY